MSKYGTIEVNVYNYFTSEQLNDFATVNHITYEQAESLAKEIVYRKKYNQLRNAAPEVKAVRKQYNAKRNALRKALNS